jgi:hypothetical protein
MAMQGRLSGTPAVTRTCGRKHLQLAYGGLPTLNSYLSRKNLPVDDRSCEKGEKAKKLGMLQPGWRCLTLVVEVLTPSALDSR